jgi:KDO2-lipid IV(A) lauroyltransferase
VSAGHPAYLEARANGRDGMAEDTGQRGIGSYLSDMAIRGIFAVMRLLPYRRRIPAMGWILSHVVAPLAGWDRRVRSNLAHVFPDLPEAEVRRLVREVPDNAGRSLMELYSGPEFAERMRSTPISGPGLPAIEAARAAKTPVVFVTGHFGNYDSIRACLRSRGYPLGALYNPMRNPFFNRHYVEAFESIGKPMFARNRQGMAEMVRFLRQGGMVGMVIDQYMSHGEMLDFLGKPAPTAISAVQIARKYGALIVPIYGIRQPDGLSFRIEVEEPLAGDDPVLVTQALNDSLSAVVRRHMGQWFWIHRRWKPERHRPAPAGEA